MTIAATCCKCSAWESKWWLLTLHQNQCSQYYPTWDLSETSCLSQCAADLCHILASSHRLCLVLVPPSVLWGRLQVASLVQISVVLWDSASGICRALLQMHKQINHGNVFVFHQPSEALVGRLDGLHQTGQNTCASSMEVYFQHATLWLPACLVSWWRSGLCLGLRSILHFWMLSSDMMPALYNSSTDMKFHSNVLPWVFERIMRHCLLWFSSLYKMLPSCQLMFGFTIIIVFVSCDINFSIKWQPGYEQMKLPVLNTVCS